MIKKITTVLHHEKHITVKMQRTYLIISYGGNPLAVHDYTFAGHGYTFS